MSKEALERFLKAAEEDERLTADLHRTVGDKTGEAARRVVANFAGERGFAVTPEDIERFGEESEREGELSDTQLDRVAGGDVPDTMLSLLCALKAMPSKPLN